ncbi:hypothetical protein D1872_219080 [compost metagenome]
MNHHLAGHLLFDAFGVLGGVHVEQIERFLQTRDRLLHVSDPHKSVAEQAPVFGPVRFRRIGGFGLGHKLG